MAKIDYSVSCFLFYLGTRKQSPELDHRTLIPTERYRELLEDIFERKILSDDFSMYLHVPTRTDPSMAPVPADPSAQIAGHGWYGPAADPTFPPCDLNPIPCAAGSW